MKCHLHDVEDLFSDKKILEIQVIISKQCYFAQSERLKLYLLIVAYSRIK